MNRLNLLVKLKLFLTQTKEKAFENVIKNQGRFSTLFLLKFNKQANSIKQNFDKFQLDSDIFKVRYESILNRTKIMQDENFTKNEVFSQFNLNINQNISLGIFVLKNKNFDLTSEIFGELSESFGSHVADFVVLDEFGNLIKSSSTELVNIQFKQLNFLNNFQKILIFFEANATSYEFVQKLKRVESEKIFYLIICFDLWRKFDYERIRKWKDQKNVRFLHIDDSLMLEPGFLEDKFFYWIYVGFHKKRINQEKQYKVLFSGGTKSYDRKVWLLCFNYFSKLFFIQSEIFLVNYTNPESRLDRHQYLELLSKNQISFSLSAKTSTKTLITFRALESLSLGCTLIQQEFSNDKPLSNHFVPYKHYLPFETVEDLAIIFKLISLEPLLIKQIGNAALEFWNNHYTEKFRWNLLIDNITLAN